MAIPRVGAISLRSLPALPVDGKLSRGTDLASKRKHYRSTGIALFGIMLVIAGTSLCGRNPNIKVVEIPLGRGVEIRPAMTKAKPPNHETFEDMVGRLRPYAAINGTYYDENIKPLGDVVIGGKVVNQGHYPNAIAITKSGKVEFIRGENGRFDWSRYQAGLAAGPRLVHRGNISLAPVADGFSRRSLTITAYRCGVGITKNNKLLLVTMREQVTLAEFAKVMLDLGAVEAMNLDGGGACGLYRDGKYLAIPALPMSNILAVYRK